MDNCMLFFHQPFLIFIDSWLTSWGPLEMRTQVSPWLSLSSNGVAESFSSLLLAILMVEEGTPSILAWKLHLQWLRDVFLCPWLFMIPRDTVDRPPLIDDILLTWDCTPWCSGISLSWFLLSMCESVSPKMVGADVFWIIQGELYPASHQHPSLSLGKA